jgi:hypothetical protein
MELAKKIIVFIIDLDPSNKLGRTFRKIGESSSNPEICIHEHAFDLKRAGQDSHLSISPGNYSP